MVVVKVKKLLENAQVPKFAYETDGCADISAAESVTIEPQAWMAVRTGLSFEIPHSFEMQIRPRSGLALKYGVTVLNSPATIDSDYRGEVKIILINHGTSEFRIKEGDRIAQVAIRPIPEVTFVPAEELSDTSRGEGGFGSTGMD